MNVFMVAFCVHARELDIADFHYYPNGEQHLAVCEECNKLIRQGGPDGLTESANPLCVKKCGVLN